MTAKIRVPTQLRTLTAGAAEIDVEGGTVADVLASLDAAHPGFRDRLFDEQGKLRRFVNVFVADEDVRFLQGLDTKVTDGQTVSIVPAVAGGAGVVVVGSSPSGSVLSPSVPSIDPARCSMPARPTRRDRPCPCADGASRQASW